MATGEAPLTLLLVHGAHAGAWVWEDLLPVLKHPAIAIDLPGHGARREPLEDVTLAACVQAVVDAAKDLSRLALVGHSMGVPIVLAAADRLGPRLAHAACIAGPVPRPGDTVVDTFPLVPRLVSRIMLRFQSKVFSQPDLVARGSLLNGVPAAKMDQACKRFGLESTAIVSTPVEWSGRPPCPTTYLRCLRDKGAMSAAYQSQMAARLGPISRVGTLDTCHYPMLERPEELGAVLNALE